MDEPVYKLEKKRSRRLDIHATTSDVPGLRGQLETFLRTFRNMAFLALLSPVCLIVVLCAGVSAAPGLYVFDFFSSTTSTWHPILHYIAAGSGIALGYLTYGFTLIFVVPTVNFILPLRLKAWRGIWFSLEAIPWFVHNALTYLVRYSFLELITPTPINVLFYRMMGMKIGRGVVINTTNISDPCMISLGDYVTIGGSAHLFAHYGQKGILVIAPVKIGDGTTIGLKASIMGDVTVGKNALIKPHAVLIPKTRIEDGETF